METSNWMPIEGTSGVVGDFFMEFGDWRDQLQADSRQRIVNKIMDTLKRHLPFSGDEGLQELRKIAVRFEDKILIAATSQSDYLRKISLKMLTMETRSQNPLPDAIQSNPVANNINPLNPDVTNSILVRAMRNKKTWTRVQDEKLVDALMELHTSGKYKYGAYNGFKPGYFQAIQNLLDISLPNSGLKAETHIKSRLKKLKSNFFIVHEMLVDSNTSGFGWDPIKCCVIADDQVWVDYLQTHKKASHFKDKSFPFYDKLSIVFGKDRATGSRDVDLADDLEETDINLGVQLTREGIDGTSSKRKRGKGLSLDSTAQTVNPIGSTGMQGSSSLTSGGLQQSTVAGQNSNLQNIQNIQQQRPMPEASSTSLDSTAQTGNPNGGDWQEEVYQKIKAMKDMYLLDLNDMHQKILAKLQQHDSLPQQPKNAQLEKLNVFKNMLERFMQFLEIPKHGISANHKDKLGTYEKQIVIVVNSSKRKPAPTQH